ncbi:hypothetical protein K523DRAFT_325521 [Schizophyllum commune Tattone D]|nr:hypothetical protein K523DRAFT_325521 [Schizophyllum commune Tattone D]
MLVALHAQHCAYPAYTALVNNCKLLATGSAPHLLQSPITLSLLTMTDVCAAIVPLHEG